MLLLLLLEIKKKKKENGFELSLILKSPWALFWESAEKREPLG